jgi:hypothetical protein
MSSVDRSQLLAAKSAEIEKLLEVWALDQGVVRPGEMLRFTMYITQQPFVAGDIQFEITGGKNPRDLLAPQSISTFYGKIIRPANLTQEFISSIISHPRLTLGLRSVLVEFFRNADESGLSYMDPGKQAEINNRLQNFFGVHNQQYRFFVQAAASCKRGKSQLWEVELR